METNKTFCLRISGGGQPDGFYKVEARNLIVAFNMLAHHDAIYTLYKHNTSRHTDFTKECHLQRWDHNMRSSFVAAIREIPFPKQGTEIIELDFEDEDDDY